MAVDGFLENSPYFEFYKQPCSVVQRKYSFNCHMQYPVNLCYWAGLKIFEDVMDNVSSNPFIGRYISVNPKLTNFFWENNDDEMNRDNYDQSLDRLCKILRRLGKYVWHLKWHVIGSTINEITFYAALCRILQELPNLKFLEAICWINNGQAEHKTACVSQSIKRFVLPRIQSLYYVHLSVDPLSFEIQNVIMSSFGNGLKKLCLPLNATMPNCLHNGLRNLNELYIWHIESKFFLSNLVSELLNSEIKVKKFKGKFSPSFIVFELLDILRPLCLEFVSFSYSKLTEECNENSVELGKLCSFESIRTIEIRDRLDLKFDFLKYLPELEYLYITTCYTVEAVYKKQAQINSTGRLEVVDHIRQCLYCDTSPTREFWDQFPNLKYVIVEYSNGDYGCVIPNYLERPLLRYVRCQYK